MGGVQQSAKEEDGVFQSIDDMLSERARDGGGVLIICQAARGAQQAVSQDHNNFFTAVGIALGLYHALAKLNLRSFGTGPCAMSKLAGSYEPNGLLE